MSSSERAIERLKDLLICIDVVVEIFQSKLLKLVQVGQIIVMATFRKKLVGGNCLRMQRIRK